MIALLHAIAVLHPVAMADAPPARRIYWNDPSPSVPQGFQALEVGGRRLGDVPDRLLGQALNDPATGPELRRGIHAEIALRNHARSQPSYGKDGYVGFRIRQGER